MIDEQKLIDIIAQGVAKGIAMGQPTSPVEVAPEPEPKPKAKRKSRAKPKPEVEPEHVEEPETTEYVEPETDELDELEEAMTYEDMMVKVKSLIAGCADGAEVGKTSALDMLSDVFKVDKFKDLEETQYAECVAKLGELVG